MPITVTSDPEQLTLTAIGEFSVPVARLWAAWADPRQLERFWGPPEWPATFTAHDMRPGGAARYTMTGPNGERSAGWWRCEVIEPEAYLELTDGFCGPDGQPDPDQPSIHMQVRFEATSGGARFVAVSTYPSVEAMEQLLAMGVVEGFTTALGQLEGVLSDLRAWSAQATLERVSPTQAVVQRVVRGTIDQVWRAFHEAPLMQRWLLGPPGWTMPVCDIATSVGQTYRFGWAPEGGGPGFAFTGELLESEPPRRAVTTERMEGMPGPGTHNTLTLRPLPGAHTEITVTIDYPNAELADQILATGMVDGMEASYQRLEAVLAG